MATATLQRISGKDAHPEDNLINLNWSERYVSIIGGVKLGFSGIKNIFKSPFSSIIKMGASGYLLNRGITGHCEIYSQIGKYTAKPVNVSIKSSFTVNQPKKKVYDFWRKLDNLPLFMSHLESVEVTSKLKSHWVLKLPAGISSVSWDAEIVDDKPGVLIGWKSLPGSAIDNAGKVMFEDTPDENVTLVHVTISYMPPVGGIGAGIATLLNPVFKGMVEDDIANFKQYMDIGDVTEEFVVVEE